MLSSRTFCSDGNFCFCLLVAITVIAANHRYLLSTLTELGN